MTRKKLFAGAMMAGAMAFSAGSASAVTFNEIDSDSSLGGSVDFFEVAPSAAIATFDWDETPFNAFVEFSSNKTFDFFFLDYLADGSQSAVSGFRLIGPDGDISAMDQTCGNAALPVQGSCQLVTGALNSGGAADSATKPDLGTPLFSDLAAGNYTLGFFESSDPASGSVVFGVTAIPLPAGLVLMLGGLGVLGFAARRKA